MQFQTFLQPVPFLERWQVAEAGGGVCDYWIDGAGGRLPPALCWDYGALNVSWYDKLALAVLKKVYNKGLTVGWFAKCRYTKHTYFHT